VPRALMNFLKAPPPSSAGRITVADCALLAALWAATAVVLGKDIALGGLADADSAAHAMDGILIHDWVMAGPSAWQSPMEFARQQYGHYPTLGIGRHYPPGFAVVEAAFFATFGISAVSARLCVLFFGLIAITGTFVFVRELAGRGAGSLAAMTLPAMPATTLWGRQTMLEVPTLAALAWGAVTFSWYLRHPSTRRLSILLAVSLGAILFKQTGVFLVCTVAMTLMVCALAKVVRVAHSVAATAVAAVAVLLVVLSFDDACFKTLSGYDTYPAPWCLGALTFYLRALPYLTGSLFLALAVLGFAVSRRALGVHWLFLLGWAVVAYLMVTAASLKVPRFYYVGVFPLAIGAALGMNRLVLLLPKSSVRPALAAVIAACLGAFAYARPIQHAPDYGPLVAAHRNQIEGRAVLFTGLRDGDFVFAVREHIPWRRAVVVRGSKLLYTCTAGPNLDLVSFATSSDALAALMHRFAFEYVFIERENKVGTVEDDLLRRYLSESGDYERISTQVLDAVPHSCRFASAVDVYKLIQPLTRQVDYFDIPMPRTGAPIRIRLSANTLFGQGPS
jgi:4-amino-4-deoxy-L-arabinose transferase-like glycosyltransferase